MIGKASITRTKLVTAYYTSSKVSERVWIKLDTAINEALEELGEVAVIDIRYNSQVYTFDGDPHNNDTALIIYRINE